MKKLQKRCALLLAIIMLLSCTAVFAGCSDATDDPVTKETEKTTDVGSEVETVEEDHRFDNIDYEGREFRIYTSTNQAGATLVSSNYLIEGSGEMGGGLVSDAVFERNVAVEELLGVNLVFTQVDVDFSGVAATIRKLTTSGLDEYDLVINDIYGITPLITEGNFRNVLEEECVFDFDRNYWYKDYMEDLRLLNDYQYVLAGDFFIDVLRTAHVMLLNKEIYVEQYRTSADEVYDWVTNYEWTYEKMNTLISDIYIDKNGDSKIGKGDRIGLVTGDFWGSTIALAASGANNYVTRDEDGVPTITIHEGDRANQLAHAISNLLNNDSTARIDGAVVEFTEGNSLMTASPLIGSLESDAFRSMKNDVAVLPFPMLFASDKKYITSTHDTTEMGVIMATSTDLAFISTVVEVLNRESARTVLPKYYSESLKLQLMDDEKSAEMLDIVHDNFDNAFILAYNQALGGYILQSFSTAAEGKREFSAVYAGRQKSVQRNLEKMIALFKENNEIN